MYRAMTEERRRHHRERSPTGALLSIPDLARIIADLTGPHFRHLNGAVIPLDGGGP
jgi:3-oxoacyl-[acyl-carrier protein] reductase